MNSTSVTTNPAVLSGSTTGPSHEMAENPAIWSLVTTTGWPIVPRGALGAPRSFWICDSVVWSCWTDPFELTPRTSRILAVILAR